MEVHVKSGSEGPAHDPYSYTEYRVKRDGRKIVMHLGMGDWIKVDGEHVEAGDAALNYIRQERKDYRKRVVRRLTDPPRRCPACKGKLESGGGYVGEEVIYCKGCGRIVWSQPVTDAMIA